MNTTELLVEIRPEKIHVRTGFEPMTSAIPWRISYITYTLLTLCVLHIYRSAHIWFSYIHNRYSSLGWFIWTQLHDQLPVGLLAQLVKRCTRIAEIGVQIPYGPEFFSGSISTTSSVVFLAARVSYIRFFTVVLIYDFHIVTIIVGLTVWVQFSQIKEKSIFSATEGGK